MSSWHGVRCPVAVLTNCVAALLDRIGLPLCRDIRNWNGGNNAFRNLGRKKPTPYAGEERLETYLNNVRAYIAMLR